MTTRRMTLRLLKNSLLLAAGIGVLLVAQNTFAADDVSCLRQGVQQRTTDIRKAYQEYGQEMGRLTEVMGKSETDLLSQTDAGYRTNETNRTYYNFSNDAGRAGQDLMSKISQAWYLYFSKRASCGYGGNPSYNYGNNYYNGSYNYNYNYGYPYGYNGYIQPQCTHPQLTQPPAGCNYACAPDGNGCQRCHLQCSGSVSYAACGCPSQYDPVCTRDGRTYDNACYAACERRDIWYDGACR